MTTDHVSTMPCPDCGGGGQGRPQDDYCLRCGGSGQMTPVEEEETAWRCPDHPNRLACIRRGCRWFYKEGSSDERCPARKEWVRDHTCKKALGHHGMHECECGEHWLNEDDWTPCPSQGWALLGVVGDGARVRCGLQIDHPGPRRFAMEWTADTGHSHAGSGIPRSTSLRRWWHRATTPSLPGWEDDDA